MLVMKFGGTSVGDARRFASVSRIIQDTKAKDERVAVVVSAMSGVTTSLVKAARAAAEGDEATYRRIIGEELLAHHRDACEALIAHEGERRDASWFIEDRLRDVERFCRSLTVLRELTVRGQDAISSIGEKLSAHILAAHLRTQGTRAQAVDATELIVTDDNFGAANPLMKETQERVRESLQPLLEQGIVPILTGYVGATAEGVTTTLGRGGSDYTAAIVGACLDAEEVWIWTDVDGILTADPNIVSEARPLQELSYVEAAELAYFGADVLHPKTIKPLEERGIPLRIVNSFNPTDPGTLIIKKPQRTPRSVQAIISTKGLSLIGVAGNGDAWTPEIAARALSRLAREGVDVLMFTQSFSERQLNLLVRQGDMDHGLKALQREFQGELERGAIAQLDIQYPMATISVVGGPGEDGLSIVPKTFAALGKHRTKVISIAQASSEYNVSFVVAEDQVDSTVRLIHEELGLGHSSAPQM
jgi:aspartokinase/homoserine dehydrogenase 1